MHAPRRRAVPSPERALGWGRLAAGASLVLALLGEVVYGYAWFEISIAVGGSALMLAGVATLALPTLDPSRSRLAAVLRWSDPVILGLLVALGPDEDAGYTLVLLLLLLTFLGLQGVRSWWVGVGIGVTAEAVRQALRPLLDHRIEPVDALLGVGLAVGLTATLARMVDLARAAEREARDSAEAARAALAEAEQAASQLDVMHRVVVSTIGTAETDALQQMVDAVAAHLGVPAVTVFLLGDGGAPRVVATSDPAVAARDDITPVTRGPFLHGPLARALDGAPTRATDDELEAMQSAGHPVHGDITVHPLRRAGGQVVGAMACGAPVGRRFSPTEDRTISRFAAQMGLAIEAARALDHETDLAARYRELDRLKTDFVAITSHELRTPLTTIVGVIETMRQRLGELRPPETERLVAALGRQAHRLVRLVDDLGTVSHVDAGTLVTIRRPTDVQAIVTEATSGLPDVPVVLHLDSEVPCADADPDRLLQVVTNLVANGDQHGSPPVHLQVGTDAASHEVVLQVWDEGTGIPPDRRDEVFDRFVRLGRTEAHSRGSGLGLAIARELVVAMGGSIAVVDRDEHSAFEVRLPVHRDAA